MSKVVKFETIYEPKTRALFRNLPGWRFDEAVWPLEELRNSSFQLADLSDISLSGIPQTMFKSGVGSALALELDEIIFEDRKTLEGWTPGVTLGSYFVHRDNFNLHGTDSIIKLTGEAVDEDDRSVVNLDVKPKSLAPVTAEYLVRDNQTMEISVAQSFEQVVKFKGQALNGRELDGDIAGNTDTDAYQFKLERLASEAVLNRRILSTDFTEIETDVYEVGFLTGVVSWYDVVFSRKDIFKTELTFDEFISRQTDPVANGALNDGDYCISYADDWSENLAARAYILSVPEDFGVVSYKPIKDALVRFNKDVRITQQDVFQNTVPSSTFYLEHLPILDSTTLDAGIAGGTLSLDQFNTTLTVAAVEWERIDDLDNAAAADQVFELDPLTGKITFGDGGVTKNGALPVGQIVVDYTQVPLIQYDPEGSVSLFHDAEENLDPLVNSNKKGFLVLTQSKPEPAILTLKGSGQVTRFTDSTCCYGPIDIPAVDGDDTITLKARVTNNGNPKRGVPNVPVQFESLDGVLSFSQNEAVTDAEGYAYTEAIGKNIISNYIVADYMYEPMDAATPDYLNPDPSLGGMNIELPLWGVHLPAANTITVGEVFYGDVDDVYLLIQSIPSDTVGNLLDYSGSPLNADDYMTPYNGRTRRGGITTVWHTTSGGAEEIVHPTSATPNAGNDQWTDFQFPINIPTGQLIVAYKIVIDRKAKVRASTLTEDLLTSNVIAVCAQLGDDVKGQWKLPNLMAPNSDGLTTNEPSVENFDSSRISSAVYMSPNDFEVTEIQPLGGGAPIVDADVGDGIDIIGTSFPTSEELKVSVFIIKTDTSGNVVAVKNISDIATFINSTTIRIDSLPTPPTEEYDINYWIAVGGFHPEDGSGVRKTAVELEIGETP